MTTIIKSEILINIVITIRIGIKNMIVYRDMVYRICFYLLTGNMGTGLELKADDSIAQDYPFVFNIIFVSENVSVTFRFFFIRTR